MATIPEYPPILQGSTENKINQLREYLARMAKVQEDESAISSKSGSGSSEPDAYLKTASVSGNTLTLTNKNDSTVQFTPTGGTGTTNFNQLSNRPSYNGVTMTGSTAIPEVKTSTWDGKQDKLVAGTNITIASDGKTISASTSEPAEYLKSASVSGNTLTLTKKDGTTETFTPTGGGTGTTDYTALSNKPSINSVQLNGNKTLSEIGAAAESHTHVKTDITDFPTLATVATSGDYEDLSNTPSVPSTYVKSASVSSNTLTLTNADDTTVSYTPSASGGDTVSITETSNITVRVTVGESVASYTSFSKVSGSTLLGIVGTRIVGEVSGTSNASIDYAYVDTSGTSDKIYYQITNNYTSERLYYLRFYLLYKTSASS